MAYLSEQSHFRLEAPDVLRTSCGTLGDDLYIDRAVELGVPHPQDVPHTAVADFVGIDETAVLEFPQQRAIPVLGDW